MSCADWRAGIYVTLRVYESTFPMPLRFKAMALPAPEVKLNSADGTALATVWENRSLPEFTY